MTKRLLYRHKAKSQGIQREPESSEEVVLAMGMLTMADGSSFLLKDDNTGERLLIFCGALGKRSIEKQERFFYGWDF